MKKFLAASVVIGALAVGGSASAATVWEELGLSPLDDTTFVSSISNYSTFLSTFTSIYNYGYGYDALAAALGATSTSLGSVVLEESFDSIWGTTITFGANKVVTLSGDYGTATDVTLSTPGPIAGAGLPVLLGLAGYGWMRRRKAA